jgi:hypothetical protein
MARGCHTAPSWASFREERFAQAGHGLLITRLLATRQNSPLPPLPPVQTRKTATNKMKTTRIPAVAKASEGGQNLLAALTLAPAGPDIGLVK